jgi:MoaA/NifB/PqqE/SkfB family radical SAM enzyme
VSADAAGAPAAEAAAQPPLTDRLSRGLAAPICLTWELTYGCNLACVHCLSSSGRRDPRELSTAQGHSKPAKAHAANRAPVFVTLGRRG